MEAQATKALLIIERYCGQTFGQKNVKEKILLINNMGRLNLKPFIRLESVSAQCETWAFSDAFGSSDLVSVPIDSVEVAKDGHIAITGGVLNTSFTSANVSYLIGYETIPEPIQQACVLLDRQLIQNKTKSNYSISALITPEIEDLINAFKTIGGEMA